MLRKPRSAGGYKHFFKIDRCRFHPDAEFRRRRETDSFNKRFIANERKLDMHGCFRKTVKDEITMLICYGAFHKFRDVYRDAHKWRCVCSTCNMPFQAGGKCRLKD